MDYNMNRLSDYSDESILDELRRVAKELGKPTMSYREFKMAGGRVSDNVITRRFGSWNAGLRRAGLPVYRRSSISNQELFTAIEEVWDKLGRQPKRDEIKKLGRFAPSTYEKRFGTWIVALEEFVQWRAKTEEGSTKEAEEGILDTPLSYPGRPRLSRRIEYGEPIDFFGLRHAPLNEQGVVYLFGILSKRLGFIIEAVRSDFPDCEGKRQITGKPGRWERVAIEFEY